jgi:P27 family predicted phage terminase small subunit
MKGQKPVPARLVAVTGNPGRRQIKQGTRGTGKIGAAPRGMSDAAKLKWVEASAEWQLVLTGSDRDGLRMYCEAWAEMMNALDRVREDGAMILTPNGMVQKSPWLTKVEQSREFCRKMLTEFGGSPSARMRVSAPDEDEEDPLDRFVN